MFQAIALMLLAQGLTAEDLDSLAAANEYVKLHSLADQALLDGDGVRALGHFDECLVLSPKNQSAAYGMASATAAMGDLVGSLSWLTRAVSWGYVDHAVAEWDDDLKSLRAEPEFEELLKKMRLKGKSAGEAYSAEIILNKSGPEQYTAGAINSKGELVVAGTSDGQLQIIAVDTGVLIAEIKLDGGAVLACDFFPNGDLLGFTMDGKLKVVTKDPEGAFKVQSTIRALEGFYRKQWDSNETHLERTHLEIGPKGEKIFVAVAHRKPRLLMKDGTKLWNGDASYSLDMCNVTVDWCPEAGLIGEIRDGGLIFFSDKDGSEQDVGIAFPADATAIAFSPNGRHLATAHGSGLRELKDGGVVTVWDLKTKKLMHRRPVQYPGDDDVSNLSFSPNGDLLYASTISMVDELLIDVASGRLLRHWSDNIGDLGVPYRMSWGDDCVFSTSRAGGSFTRMDTKAFSEFDFADRGKILTSSEKGQLLVNASESVFLLGPENRKPLWRFRKLKSDDGTFQTSGGYFSGSINDWEGMVLKVTEKPEPDSFQFKLSAFASFLYDPKRVRASIAGVTVLPVTLERAR